MNCPKCGADIDAHTSNCHKCGNPIIRIKPMRVCTNCGSDVPDEADKCPGCGRTIKRRKHQTAGGFGSTNTSGAGWVSASDASGTGAFDGGMSNAKGTAGGFIAELKKEKYAWLQAIVPGVLALAYHWLVLRDNMEFNLANTFLIFEALVFIFGYMDIKDLEKRPEMMGGLVYSSRFVYMSYFLPILSLWERKQLPGMNRRAMYPLVHTVLFTILVFSVMISMNSVGIDTRSVI